MFILPSKCLAFEKIVLDLYIKCNFKYRIPLKIQKRFTYKFKSFRKKYYKYFNTQNYNLKHIENTTQQQLKQVNYFVHK